MGLFDWLFGRPEPDAEAFSPELLALAREYALKVTDPRLRLASQSERRLTAALSDALRHVRALVAALPPAVPARPEGWMETPALRAMFASGDDISRVLGASATLRAVFEANPVADTACAILGTWLVEQTRFGMALENGIVRQDVAQKTLSFREPRIRLCAVDQAALTRTIARGVFDILGAHAMGLIAAQTDTRKALESERALLQTRLRALQAQGKDLGSVLAQTNGDEQPPSHDSIEAELADNARRLEAFRPGAEQLDRELDTVCEVFAHAGRLIVPEPLRVKLSLTNVLLPEESTEPAVDLALPALQILTDPPTRGVALPVTVWRADMPAAQPPDWSGAAHLL